MKWMVADQEVDQQGVGEKLCKYCQAHKLNREYATDRSRWSKLIKVGFQVSAHPDSSGQAAVKRLLL